MRSRRLAQLLHLRVVVLVLSAGPLVTVGCDEDPTNASNDTITLTAPDGKAEASIEADGFSRVRLTASIPQSTPTDRRTLRFRTTRGQFVGATTVANSENREVELLADGTGKASVDLQSGTVVEEAEVTAFSTGAPKPIAQVKIKFIPLSDTSVVRFTGNAVVAPADGLTASPIAVRIDPRVPATSRSATLRATSGVFLTGVLAENGTVTTIAIDASNAATVALRSSVRPETANVRVSLHGVSRHLAVTFTPIAIDDYIRILAPEGPLEADGASVVPLEVWVSRRFRDTGRLVRFEAAGSQFVVNADNAGTSASVLLGQQDTVRAFLRSPTSEGPVPLRVVVGDLSATRTLSFSRALPDAIVVDAGKFSMGVAEETTVSATLQRRNGSPTPNLPLRFEALDATSGAPVGVFRAQTAVSATKATAVFAPIGVAAPATVRLRVSTLVGNRVGETTIRVVP